MSAFRAFLTKEEVEHLTARTKPSAQRRALEKMRIQFWTRPDGRPIIARATIDHAAEQTATAAPNWSAL